MLPSAFKYISHLFTGLVLALSLTYSSPVSAKKCPKLATLIEDLSQSQSDLLRFAEQGKLPDSQEHLVTFFKFSDKKYNKKFANKDDINSFQKDLKKIIETGGISTKKMSEFKANRVLALRVRSNYVMFSEAHKPPKGFQKFVRDFGNLNDALAEKDPAAAKAMATELLKHIDSGFHKTKTFGFTPAPSGSIVKFSTETLTEIEAGLTAQMDIHRYHDIRKKIRNFKALYDVFDKVTPSPVYKKMAKAASKISDDMGQVKEVLFLDKEHLNAKVQIDKTSQADIKDFINEFRKLDSK